MAETLNELLDLIEAGDEDAKQRLRDMLSTKDQEVGQAKRALALKTDDKLRERYPRALRAWEKGHLRLEGTLTDEEMVEALKAEEEKLAELGVPISTSASAEVVATKEEPVPVAPTQDPAKALAGTGGGSGPGGSPRDLFSEYMEAIKGTTKTDRYKANRILVELNQTGRQAEIKRITDSVAASPITPATI